MLEPELSVHIEGTPVRRFDLDGVVWHVPYPLGFSDLETLTQETLPERLHVDAYNLREFSLAFFATPASQGGGLPHYSTAEIGLYNKEVQSYLFMPPSAQEVNALRQEYADTPLLRYLRGEAALLASEEWEVLCSGMADFPYEVDKDNSILRPGVTLVHRDWNPGEKEALYDEMEATDNMATGGVAPEGLPGVFVSVGIPFGEDYIMLLVQVGPERTLQNLQQAYSIATRWKQDFFTLNRQPEK